MQLTSPVFSLRANSQKAVRAIRISRSTLLAIAVLVPSVCAPQMVQAQDVIAAPAAPVVATAPVSTASAHSSVTQSAQSVVVHVANFEKVSPVLMRGAAPSANALKELKAAGVKTIINLRGDGGASKKEERIAKEIGLEYYNIPMGFAEPNLAKVSSALDIMRDPARQPVYIHCLQGADRTGMMVGINRVLSDGWQFDKTYTEMRGHHFKPFLIPMRRTVQAFATGKYTYVEKQGVSIAGVQSKTSAAKIAEKAL